MTRSIVCLLALGLFVGCGQKDSSTASKDKTSGKTPSTTSAEGKEYVLSAEPQGAKGVLEARKETKSGDDIVLVGRIAGSEKPFVDGRASFMVTDLSIKPCEADEGCPTPWDCCCTPTEELLPATAHVKFVGPDGKTLPVAAQKLLGVKELAVVVVKGKADRDDKGNLTVVANGLYQR